MRATGNPGTIWVLVTYNGKRTLKVHFTDYWHCYDLDKTAPDGGEDLDSGPETYLIGEEPMEP